MPRWCVGIAICCVVGCAVEPVDLNGKACPCAPPAVCDELTQRCESGCVPAARAEDFAAVWATPHQILWTWTPVGEREDFVRYEVEVAASPAELGTETARIIGPDENPELGNYVLPRTGGPDDVVTSTITRGHIPSTTYAARLLVTDTSFCTFESPVAAFNTTLLPPGEGEIVLYDGPRPEPGFPIPNTMTIVDDGEGGLATEQVISQEEHCIADMNASCSVHVKWSGLEVDVSAIEAGSAGNVAYVEAWLTSDVDLPSFSSTLWVRMRTDDVLDQAIYRHEFFTIPSSAEPRRYEVPLRALMRDGQPLTHAILQSQMIDQLNIGGHWSRCAIGETGDPCSEGRLRLHRFVIRH